MRDTLATLGDIGVIIGIPMLFWEIYTLRRENRRLRDQLQATRPR